MYGARSRIGFTPFTIATVVVLLSAFALAAVAEAQLSKPDRKQIKRILDGGTLYARIDMPCETGRHPFGTYKAPLVEVSPEGENTEGGLGLNASFWHAQSTYWGVGPNATLRFDEAEFDGNTLEAEFEGVGEWDGTDTVIKFVGINSVADFEAAFDRAFARQPLQDEHPEWPQEIRDAIARGELVEGMNKRQAYIVVGAPSRFETSEQNGKKVEIWYTRQERGLEVGFWTTRSGRTGYPAQLRFEDGELTSFDSSGGQLSLDD